MFRSATSCRIRPAPALLVAMCLCAGSGCRKRQSPPTRPVRATAQATRPAPPQPVARLLTDDEPRRPRDYQVVHVFVCLADNRHQGIVPVPAALGNGQDPAGNLYWGAMYGVKTFFRRSGHWESFALRGLRPDGVLDRVAFRGTWPGARVYVVAEAYDGARMATALRDFLAAAGGGRRIGVGTADPRTPLLQAGGWADLVCFVGHNGLMEAPIPNLPARGPGGDPAHAVVLACKSRDYFTAPLARAGCEPLVTTTGLMAPEAYTLDAIIRSWAGGADPDAVRTQAAIAYAKYQKCGLPAARRLFGAGS